MGHAELGHVGRELLPANSGPLSLSTPRSSIPLREDADHLVDEAGGDGCGLLTDDQLRDRPARRGVDRGELEDRADPFQLADGKGVEGDEIAWSGSEVAEPEGTVARLVGDEAGFCGGDLRERRDPLATVAEVVAEQHPLHARARQHDLPLREVLEEPSRPEGRARDGFGEDDLDDVHGCRVRLPGGSARLRHERGQSVTRGTVRPVVVALAGDPEGPTARRHAVGARVVEHADATVVDDLVQGHGGGLQFFGRNLKTHHRGPINGGWLSPLPVNSKY